MGVPISDIARAIGDTDAMVVKHYIIGTGRNLDVAEIVYLFLEGKLKKKCNIYKSQNKDMYRYIDKNNKISKEISDYIMIITGRKKYGQSY